MLYTIIRNVYVQISSIEGSSHIKKKIHWKCDIWKAFSSGGTGNKFDA